MTNIFTKLMVMNSTKGMTTQEKIMYLTEKVLHATSQDSAVSMEQIIEKGISLGITEDYPRGKEDGHPYYPATSVMMGVGSISAVMNHEEFYLHRKKMTKTDGNTCMYYWVDRSHKHEVVRRNSKADGLKQAIKSTYQQFPSVKITYTMAEKMAKVAQDPGKYRLVNGHLLLESWIQANPEKFQTLYGCTSI